MNYICENCGCSHDGTYGSGRFCSKHCKSAYNGKKSSTKFTKGHEQYATGRTWFKAFGGWKCKHCKNVFNTKRELQQHVHEQHARHDGHVWNYGLTKETNGILAEVSLKMKMNFQMGILQPAGSYVKWTEERRKQQSERKKLLYQEHPEKHPNYKCAGNRKKMTYPEQIVHDWLKAYGYMAIHNFRFVTEHFTRYIDFYIPHLHLFIEVDGEHWHKNPVIDSEKDADAKKNGFITLRIKPKFGVIKQLNDYFNEMKF